MDKTIKSIFYVVLSALTIYFLNGIFAKIINLIASGYERTFCIAVYWIGILSIIGVPQYWTWFTEEDVDIIAPIKSMAVFAISIFAVVGVTLIVTKILDAISLSTTSGIIYTICFWLFAICVMYVPQVFVYEPLRERYGDGLIDR